MYIHGEKGGGGALTGVSGEYQLSGSVSAYQEQDRRSVALFLLLHLHLSAALNTMKLVLRGDIFQWFYSYLQDHSEIVFQSCGLCTVVHHKAQFCTKFSMKPFGAILSLGPKCRWYSDDTHLYFFRPPESGESVHDLHQHHLGAVVD